MAIALLGEAVIATGRVNTVFAGTDFPLFDLPESLAGDALDGGAFWGVFWGVLSDVFSGAAWSLDDFVDLIATDCLAEDLAADFTGALCADALVLEGLFTDGLATEPLAPFAQNRPLQTTKANRARRGPPLQVQSTANIAVTVSYVNFGAAMVR